MMDSDIGGRVRLAREQRGLTLGDAARLTKLSTGVLRAIEQNDFASLPAGMYRKAYLRTVAAEVGLDPLEIATDYQTQYETSIVSATAASELPMPRDRSVRLCARRTVVAVIVGAMLWVAWFAVQHDSVFLSLRSVAEIGLFQ